MKPGGLAWLPLFGLLGGCGGADSAAEVAGTDPGARLYALHCSAFHQSDGSGRDGAQPSLVGAPTVAGDPEPLIRWLLFNERPATLAPRRYASVMPAFGWLSDAELAAMLSHVRSVFGNEYPAVTPAMVAAARRLQR